MATQTVEFRAAPGLTLTAKLFTAGSDTVVQTASAVTEATNRKGTYAATFTDPGAAEFELIVLSGTTPVARWFCTLTLSTATFQAYEVRTAAVVARVTANTDQWGGVTVTGMPLPTASYTAPPSVSQVVTGVYAALPADHTVSGSYGVRFILGLNTNRTVQVTGSHHIAADVHEFQPDVIDAAALAADAVQEIQSGLATSNALSTAQTDLDDIQTRLPAVLVGGRMDSYTGAMGTDVVNSGALASSAVNEIQSGLATSGDLATAQADLDNIQTRLPTALVSGRMDSYTGAMGNDVITAASTDATFAAEINAQVLDVLATDLFTELSTIPAASSSLKDKIVFLFMLARNKMTSSSTTATLFRDDGTTTVGTSPQGELAGVFTRGEFS
jgi:hypothetical protein